MPVTIKTAEHGSEHIKINIDRIALSPDTALVDILRQRDRSHSIDQFYQSSFDKQTELSIETCPNGFMTACITAYSHHQHLKIRPDDIWLAILTQFNYFVNAHGEELRSTFVEHEGRKNLRVAAHYTPDGKFDVTTFAKDMYAEIRKNIKDGDLCRWVVPSFTTTTTNDTVIATIVMMSTLQTYFRYGARSLCGIPTVTLLGDKSDYEDIYQRLKMLAGFGPEPTHFAQLLRPILSRFIRSFDDPTSDDVIGFWQRIYADGPNMSGTSMFNGWITAFNYWSPQGRCTYNLPTKLANDRERAEQQGFLFLDDVIYHRLDRDHFSNGWCRVPLTMETDIPYSKIEATLLAGSIGMEYGSSTTEPKGSAEPCSTTTRMAMASLDTIQPVSAWFLFKNHQE